ncbi:glycosyl transferase family 2 [Shewanella baltica OS625]|nr:glycosyltransferase [Shewanella baltica]ADT95181.1 glycosyl transferase family 2 [Shewanella baltica OS678]EHC06310.1 glycosyl transferase family 2 [Shewanella baltica OS625]
MNTISNKQIVTVAVITYHSAATVLETLDSIVGQSYGPKNIELIISDDGSKDNTVQIINEWLALHRAKFHTAKFFANEVNGGISKNCNVAWKAATSEWIKTIAGDDILLPNCLTDNIDFISVTNVSHVAAIFSLMKVFHVASNEKLFQEQTSPSSNYFDFFELSAAKQNKYLKIHGLPIAPSSFIRRVALADVGYADERFKLMEDYPLWFKFTLNNYSLKLMKVPTVCYRKAESMSNTKQKLINEVFLYEVIKVDKLLILPTISKYNSLLKLRKKYWPYFLLFVSGLFNNRPTNTSRLVVNVIYLFKPGALSFQMKKIKHKLGF